MAGRQSLITIKLYYAHILMKRYLLVALLIMVATTATGQVLGGPSTYGSNSGLGIYMGTHNMVGRSFAFEYNAVVPENYKPRLFNPILGIGWWSEFPSDNFVIGYQIMGNYGVEKYHVTFDKETLTDGRRSLGAVLSCYVGWHFGESLTACIGVSEESRLTVGDGGRVNIFNTQNAVGLMALVRYAFAEDYFVSLQGVYGLTDWGTFNMDWEEYRPIGESGYSVVESGLKPLSVMFGIGKGF